MMRPKSQFREPRIGGFAPRTLWRLVRAAVRGLALLHLAARALPAGRVRARLLRELDQGLGLIETAVRCLLLVMRVPVRGAFAVPSRCVRGPGPSGPGDAPRPDWPELPDVPLPPGAEAAGRPAPRFSLCMKEFPRRAGPPPVPAVRSRGHAPARRRPLEQRLSRRLSALRAALARPDREAARMAAFMMARGYRRRALPVLRPLAGFGPGPARRPALVAPARPRPVPPPDTS